MPTREEKIKEYQEKAKKYYQDLFTGEAGEFVLDDLKRRCYAEQTTFSENSLQFAFREGVRSVYLHILRMLREKPKEEV